MGLLDRIDCYKAAIDKLRPFEGDLLAQIKNYYRRRHIYGDSIFQNSCRAHIKQSRPSSLSVANTKRPISGLFCI